VPPLVDLDLVRVEVPLVASGRGVGQSCQVLRFFVDAVLTGRILDIDATASPEEATRTLGTDYGENKDRNVMWRDYGVVELHWDRASAAEPWSCHHISLQTHRMGDDDDPDGHPMNENVRQSYGAFTAPLRFAALLDELARQGCALTSVPRPAGDDVREFVYRPTGVSILVSTVSDDLRDDGDVWQVALFNAGRWNPAEVNVRP
jgi:hypothetical protein